MTPRERDIEQWLKLSEYDLTTAQAMLDSKRYLYVLFCCQQSLEKYLKGLVVRETGEFPPRTHDLIRLATLAKLSLTDQYDSFLRRITNYYIGTRYPEEVARLAQEVNQSVAKEYFEKTQEVISWFEQMQMQK